MGGNDYIGRALVRLKRRYGRDELVSTFMEQVKQKDILIGMLKSEIDHLQSELEAPDREEAKAARIEARKMSMYKDILQANKKLREKIKRLQKDNRELICKLNAGSK